MIFDWGDLEISPYVDIISQTDLILDSQFSHIYSGTPASLQAKTGSFHLYRNLTITRDSNQYEAFYMKTQDKFNCSSIIELAGNAYDGKNIFYIFDKNEFDCSVQYFNFLLKSLVIVQTANIFSIY